MHDCSDGIHLLYQIMAWGGGLPKVCFWQRHMQVDMRVEIGMIVVQASHHFLLDSKASPKSMILGETSLTFYEMSFPGHES